MQTPRPRSAVSVGLMTLALALLPAACTSPLDYSHDEQLRSRVMRDYRENLTEVAGSASIEVTREGSDVEESLTEERLAELDRMAGPDAYSEDKLNSGIDLVGTGVKPGLIFERDELYYQNEQTRRDIRRIRGNAGNADSPLTPQQQQRIAELEEQIEANRRKIAEIDKRITAAQDTVTISLQSAIQTAIRRNIDLEVARFVPKVAATQITQAEAVFDWVFFGSLDYSKLDTPQPGGIVPGLSSNTQRELLDVVGGLRKPLRSGGQVNIQTDLTRDERTPSVFAVDSFYDADVSLSLTQPVLRGFGEDVNEANITLARSARAAELENLRSRMIQLAADVEQAYWQLVNAKFQLLIQNRLLQRTMIERDRLVRRQEFDVSPVRITQANSFVELRRSDVIRARNNLRLTSDQLKRLLNDPQLPLSEETLLLPENEPIEDPITFNLLDTVTTALKHRPEMQTAFLEIKDASVRQFVADNNRLPLLNLSAGVAYNGLDVDDAGGAYSELAEGDFIDYVLGFEFERPLGNREAEALFTQRILEREAAVADYQRQSQDVVLEVKNALRDLQTTYELIGATRAARRAAADNLRAIQEQEEAGVALTPEFLLDLKLQTQERLADAERQEISAMTDYNNAIAQLYRAMGTLLDRNGISFDQDQQLWER